MAPFRTRLPKLCIGRSMARAQVRLPSLRPKPTFNPKEQDQKIEFLCNGTERFGGDGHGNGNKVMVVVDSSIEAKGALEWALSYTVQSQDTIVLLYVAKPSKQGQINCHFELQIVTN